jgi:hypothetical protein
MLSFVSKEVSNIHYLCVLALQGTLAEVQKKSGLQFASVTGLTDTRGISSSHPASSTKFLEMVKRNVERFTLPPGMIIASDYTKFQCILRCQTMPLIT